MAHGFQFPYIGTAVYWVLPSFSYSLFSLFIIAIFNLIYEKHSKFKFLFILQTIIFSGYFLIVDSIDIDFYYKMVITVMIFLIIGIINFFYLIRLNSKLKA